MPRPKKHAGRTPGGANGARTKSIAIKLSEAEYDAIAKAVRGTTATVSSWLRDHGLKPLGLVS